MFCLYLLVFLQLTPHARELLESTDVIVIGAGAAGIAAARELTNQGSYKVIVLEARTNRYGGRIWTNTEAFPNVSSGPVFDMGASFIHHPSQDNPIVQLHQEFGIPILDVDYNSTLVVHDGVAYTDARVKAAVVEVKEAFKSASKYSISTGRDMAVKEAWWKTNKTSTLTNPLSQVTLADIEFLYGAPVEQLSARHFLVGYENATADSDKTTSRGYSKLLDKLVQRNASDTPLNIRLGEEVTEVKILFNRKVSITCRSGKRYEAEAVIVTLPLGVLKAKAVRFIPELSEKKLSAIDRLGFGTVNKVVLEFDRIFWPKEKETISLVMSNVTQRGELCLFSTFQAGGNRPILVGYAVSYFGAESESLSDNELQILAVKRLRAIFGRVIDNVTVVNMARSRWFADPFSRGSYSFPEVGIQPDDWDVIGEPSPPLFFAGEHTRTYMYGTVQNAIGTGWRAAHHVEDYLNKRSNNDILVSPTPILLFVSIFIVHMNIYM